MHALVHMANNTLTPSGVHRLVRSEDNKMISGVCAGIANYFAIDPTIVRVLAVALTIVTGIVPGVIAYFVLALVMPKVP